MAESFGGKKPYYEDTDMIFDNETDPYSEEPVNIIIKNNKKTKEKSKKSKEEEDKSENQDIPDAMSMF